VQSAPYRPDDHRGPRWTCWGESHTIKIGKQLLTRASPRSMNKTTAILSSPSSGRSQIAVSIAARSMLSIINDEARIHRHVE